MFALIVLSVWVTNIYGGGGKFALLIYKFVKARCFDDVLGLSSGGWRSVALHSLLWYAELFALKPLFPFSHVVAERSVGFSVHFIIIIHKKIV